MLIETNDMKSILVGHYLSQIHSKLIRQLYQTIEPQIPDWMAITKTSLTEPVVFETTILSHMSSSKDPVRVSNGRGLPSKSIKVLFLICRNTND